MRMREGQKVRRNKNLASRGTPTQAGAAPPAIFFTNSSACMPGRGNVYYDLIVVHGLPWDILLSPLQIKFRYRVRSIDRL